ncbi:MAG: hypothetical protein HOE14_10520 [Gemmatimonadales bacterium]|jgi:hypothetical protein|nr:hypothetical protein [Gemmatimonadales bacterium]
MKLSCGDSRCTNGWYRWNGSDYPCAECRELAEARNARAKPVHEHDCVNCTFLGTSTTQSGEAVDHYFCAIDTAQSLVARRSSDGPDYSSLEVGLAAVVLPRMQSNYVLHTTMQLFQARELNRVMEALA